MWIAFNKKLRTNAWRSKWSSTSVVCPFCDAGTEDVMHILRDCLYASEILRLFSFKHGGILLTLGWVKLNVDGAMCVTNKKSGCGGVLHDDAGKWIAGFTHFIGFCNANEAEK
ncbi:uncharacterized protein LOC114719609 [Neltuma alba]|uniref:uncharacterized protein LOC114718030 n=1 Tax=Neltuma alba TaxID=207710 RepID=UPI0010A3C2F8|nr:uncharacterized protein LOC114718030 [Prosopis alba]XP_028760955.1 uncharacterized protein LOC114719609 [Prosopis alba]